MRKAKKKRKLRSDLLEDRRRTVASAPLSRTMKRTCRNKTIKKTKNISIYILMLLYSSLETNTKIRLYLIDIYLVWDFFI